MSIYIYTYIYIYIYIYINESTGALFSPEKLDLNEEPKSSTTPFKDEKKDAQDKNRTVVKVQMVDLAGSEKVEIIYVCIYICI
jgi:hypothetical protein